MNLRERYDNLEPREQRLALIFGGVLGAMLVLLVPILLSAAVSSSKNENESIREVMAAIDEARPALEHQETERQKVLARYARPAPPLTGFIEALATANGIQIPESQDQPVVPHGKKYDERSTKIVLTKVGMKNFASFLEAVVNAGYPVRVSSLNIHRRGMDPDSYDITVVFAAFDRKEPEKKAAAPESSAQAVGSAP